MNISQLIYFLLKKMEEDGDIKVLVSGHPGEYGSEIEKDDFFVKTHEGKIVLFLSF